MGPSSTSTSSRRTSHSRSGCATCRRRRVRCDERRDVCSNCSRLGLTCSWYRPAELLQRSRVNTACERCRKKKIRCTSAWAYGPCDPCQSAGAACINENHNNISPRPNGLETLAAVSSSRHPGEVSPTAATSNATGIELPSTTEVRRLVDAYFEGPHLYCFYAFIHQPTFLQMLENDTLPSFLLLIVLATSLHFLDPENRLADRWADECRRLIMLEIFSPPSVTTLQALLLLQRYDWHRASHISAWFVSGLAVRLAHGLQLHIEIHDRARVPVTVREVRRRLTWSCFVMESMIDAGSRPLSGLDVASIDVKVPCNERAFQLGIETTMPDLNYLLEQTMNLEQDSLATSPTPLVPENVPGISAFLVKLAVLRRDILNYAFPYHPRNQGRIPREEPWALGSPFFEYEEKLEQWRRCLPQELRFNDQVMYRRRSRLVSFVTLHCLYHGCYCDLYRIGSHLTASRRSSASTASHLALPESFLSTCRRGRLQHAFSICEVISRSMEYNTSDHDPVVGISAALAMRVLVIERQADDSAALGITDEAVFTRLDAAVQCAKAIAKRSVPIRELFCSICALARKHGYYVDLAGIAIPPIGEPTNQPSSKKGEAERERAVSPSLRTYGTFGSIQKTLAERDDILAPAVSSSTDKESDIFSNFAPSRTNTRQSYQQRETLQHGQHGAAPQVGVGANSQPLPRVLDPWAPDSYMPQFEGFSPNDLGMASGWGDGTLNFSMMPLQFDWINQSLGFDFGNDGTYES